MLSSSSSSAVGRELVALIEVADELAEGVSGPALCFEVPFQRKWRIQSRYFEPLRPGRTSPKYSTML